MRGSSTAPSGIRSAISAARLRAARRVGTKIVPSESESGSPATGQPGTSVPAKIASAKAGRNAAPGGMVKTFGRSADTLFDLLFSFCDRCGRAHMQPEAIESQAVEAAGSCSSVEQEIEGKRAVRRVLEEFRRHDEHACIDEGRDLVLA